MIRIRSLTCLWFGRGAPLYTIVYRFSAKLISYCVLGLSPEYLGGDGYMHVCKHTCLITLMCCDVSYVISGSHTFGQSFLIGSQLFALGLVYCATELFVCASEAARCWTAVEAF